MFGLFIFYVVAVWLSTGDPMNIQLLLGSKVSKDK